jgi:acetolactate synthase-1/2/3 large subunit
LITGLLEAQKSSIPVIAFVQEISLKNRGRHAASELDHGTCLAPYAKWVGRIELPERATEITRHAFRIATSGRPGPVVVLCPADVMAQTIDAEIEVELDYRSFPSTRMRPERDKLNRAAELLLDARNPVIVAGGGVIISQAWDEVVSLAERLQAVVVTTMNGKGAIADDHPLSAGVTGTSTGGRYGRGKIANDILAEADVALIIGSRNGQICSFNWTLPRPGTRVIHIDIDPMEIGRNIRTDVPLAGDARDTLRDLIELLGNQPGAAVDPMPRLMQLREEWTRSTREVFTSSQMPIRPERLLREISQRVADGSIVVTDASYVTGWGMSHIDSVGQGRAMISPRGTGGIGWSLPAAIGAKMASPDQRVICITGDGAFSYVLNELETAARYKVPLVVIVFNNATLAFQKHYEEKLLGTYRECDFLEVDYSELARSLHCNGERVTDPAHIGPALDRALAFNGPYVLDVLIDPDAMAPIVGLEREEAMESH